jgi:hypothetical protein
MRVFFCLFLLLPACASRHTVRCDAHLQPINLPVARVAAGRAPVVSLKVAPGSASPPRAP